MRSIQLPGIDRPVSALAFGCMHLGGNWETPQYSAEERNTAFAALEAGLEAGFTLFDHADIYTLGKSESIFGDFLEAHPGLRDRIILQTKCGIRFAGQPHLESPQRYDFSYEHIVHSVEASLRRLRTDRLDLLLLHRPDMLAEPEEVERAFDLLFASGKVLAFGMSNQHASSLAFFQAFLSHKIQVNQVEASLLQPALFTESIFAVQEPGKTSNALGTLEYCRMNNVRIQAWAPLGKGKLFDPSVQHLPNVQATRRFVGHLCEKYHAPEEAILLTWLMRHPAGIQPVIGSTKPERIRAAAKAADISLSREEWYTLLNAWRGDRLP